MTAPLVEGASPAIAFRLPPEVTARLDRVAKAQGKTRSDVIRDAIGEWLAAHGRLPGTEAEDRAA